MRSIKYIVLVLACLASVATSTSIFAQPNGKDNGINQAIRSVEQQTGGRVLAAEKRRIKGQVKYRLKVLSPSGRVRIIHIDAE